MSDNSRPDTKTLPGEAISGGHRRNVDADHAIPNLAGTMMRASPWNSRRRLCADNVQGLIGEISIAATLLGDDTLALCAEDCLSASVTFSVPHNGERLDTRARLRRVLHQPHVFATIHH